MATNFEELKVGSFYHIYNRGINSCNLFEHDKDYQKFLALFEKFINPIANAFAWVLMPNHFHLLVSIKENIIYKLTNADKAKDAVWFEENKWETVFSPDGVIDPSALKNNGDAQIKIPNPTKHFSHLFNAYAKYYNTCYHRHGSLFERPFKRKIIDSDEYLKQVILYIHNNPVHHGFVDDPIEYGWSSYFTCTSDKENKLQREEVLNWFEDKENFEYCHRNYKPDSVFNLSAFEM